jgi:hypothetical protein
MTEKLAIELRGDAHDKADRHNHTIQATISAKEGAAKAITVKVGANVNDIVL